MADYRIAVLLIVIGCVIAIFIGLPSFSNSKQEWQVTNAGLLEYPPFSPEYQQTPSQSDDNSLVYVVKLESRGAQIAGILREPQQKQGKGVPGIVLLPGATVTKEREQGLAKYLCSLGYASITIDQRNLGGIDIQGDLDLYQKGMEPIEYKMVHDALAAAVVLRNQSGVDPTRILYAGESNGARFAVIACALDPKARGVIAVSTSGFGVDEAVAAGKLTDANMIRFYRSIDPETYLSKIPPRKLVMIHSRKDPVIPYEDAEAMYEKALQPKEFYSVDCAVHGHCSQMDTFIEMELKEFFS